MLYRFKYHAGLLVCRSLVFIHSFVLLFVCLFVLLLVVLLLIFDNNYYMLCVLHIPGSISVIMVPFSVHATTILPYVGADCSY